MTENALLLAIKAAVIAQTWSGGNVVFPSGCVAITSNSELATEFAMKNFRTPFCLIQPGNTSSDPKFDEAPDLSYLDVAVRLIVMIPGDPVGENCLIGANQTNGPLASEGQGLFQIEPQLFAAIGKLNAANGLTIQFRQKGALTAGTLENGSYVAYRDSTFQAICTLI